MKKYICLNHGECNWADEKPPREFTLPVDEENVCPNCESANIRESEKTPIYKPWLIPVLAAGVIGLASFVWWGMQPEAKKNLPLKIEIIGFDCKTGILSLTSTGGDGSPLTFAVENLNSVGNPGEFVIPIGQRSNATIRLSALQSAVTYDTTYRTTCSPPPPPPGPTPPPGDKDINKRPKVRPTAWTVVEGSGYCDPALDGTYTFSEKDNLGRIRERKTTNSKCYAAKK